MGLALHHQAVGEGQRRRRRLAARPRRKLPRQSLWHQRLVLVLVLVPVLELALVVAQVLVPVQSLASRAAQHQRW